MGAGWVVGGTCLKATAALSIRALLASVSGGTLADVVTCIAVFSATCTLADAALTGIPGVAIAVGFAFAVSVGGDTLARGANVLAGVAGGTEVVGNTGLGTIFAVEIGAATRAFFAVCVRGTLSAKLGRGKHVFGLASAVGASFARTALCVCLAAYVCASILVGDTLFLVVDDATGCARWTTAIGITSLETTVTFVLALADIAISTALARVFAGLAVCFGWGGAFDHAGAFCGVTLVTWATICIGFAFATVLIDKWLDPGHVRIHPEGPACAVTQGLAA